MRYVGKKSIHASLCSFLHIIVFVFVFVFVLVFVFVFNSCFSLLRSAQLEWSQLYGTISSFLDHTVWESIWTWVELLFCRSRNGQQGRLLCPKLVVVKTEPKEEEATSSYQIKSEQAKPYQTRTSNSSGTKSTKSSSRKALESCLLSSSKVEKYLWILKRFYVLLHILVKLWGRAHFKTFPPVVQWRAEPHWGGKKDPGLRR